MRRLNDILLERVATRTAELRTALDAERQINLLKTSFVGMVSHEFRTPLGIIHTATELLSRYDGRLSTDQRSQYTGSIMGAVKRMTGMMEHILLLSGNVVLAPTRIDLAAWLPETLREIKTSCPSRDISPNHSPAELENPEPVCPVEHEILLEIDPAEELRRVRLDESLLHHIVGNLFSNACKYSPPGSRIHLTLRHSPPGFIFTMHNAGDAIPRTSRPSFSMDSSVAPTSETPPAPASVWPSPTVVSNSPAARSVFKAATGAVPPSP